MKLSLVPILALVAALPVLALPEPVAAPAAERPAPTVYPGPPVKVRELEKRDIDGVVKVDGLRYRTCPRTSCTAVGQYSIGTPITMKCYTVENTTVVNGDA